MAVESKSKILDCRATSEFYFDWVKEQKSKLHSPPTMATIICSEGSFPDSLQYRNFITKDAARLGLGVKNFEVAGEKELGHLIKKINQDDDITGIMIFYPIDGASHEDDIMDLVAPEKDVEGLHSLNLGYLLKYKRCPSHQDWRKCVVPATAKGVVKTLQFHNIEIEGRLVTIVNNSLRVGKPLGLMLENLGATVIKCYDKTPLKVLEASVRASDILITAVPDAKFAINPHWVKPQASVVDISFQGNIDAEKVGSKVSWVTSPDNRIGRVTRAMIFVNLIYCAQNIQGAREKQGSPR